MAINIHQLHERARLYAARMRVENPSLPITPRFHTTQLILLILALLALFYGHVFQVGVQARPFSLLTSFVTWGASLVLVLGNNSIQHFKILLLQLGAIVLTTLFLISSGVTYSLINVVANVLTSIKIAWIGSTVLLGIIAIIMLFIAFRRPGGEETDYPGRLTAPILFILLLINYLWWNWSLVINWIR